MTDPYTYVVALQQIGVNLQILAREADRLSGKDDLVGMSDALYIIRERRRSLGDVERHLESALAEAMEQDQMNLGDVMTLERRTGNVRTKWQSDDILSALWMRSFVPDVDGWVDPAGQPERFLDAVKACVPLTPSLSWRAGALREHGLDPDEYAEVKPGRVSVLVQRTGEKQ